MGPLAFQQATRCAHCSGLASVSPVAFVANVAPDAMTRQIAKTTWYSQAVLGQASRPWRDSSNKAGASMRIQENSAWPMNSPRATPGGMANTAEPMGVVHSFKRSSSASRFWMGKNW